MARSVVKEKPCSIDQTKLDQKAKNCNGKPKQPLLPLERFLVPNSKSTETKKRNSISGKNGFATNMMVTVTFRMSEGQSKFKGYNPFFSAVNFNLF